MPIEGAANGRILVREYPVESMMPLIKVYHPGMTPHPEIISVSWLYHIHCQPAGVNAASYCGN